MFKKKKILAIIPARGGSKGVPRKNIKVLNGKPLISYAINSVLSSKFVDRVIVSTDDGEIAKVAKRHGAEVPFLRPSELAEDTSPTLSVLQHAVNFLEQEGWGVDLIVLIQPTTPLVLSQDVDSAIKELTSTSTNSCVSVCEITERPEDMYTIENNKTKMFLKDMNPDGFRRQDLPKIYRLNGAIYVIERDILMKENTIIDLDSCSAVVIPKERSLDIDEPIDFCIIEAVIEQSKN